MSLREQEWKLAALELAAIMCRDGGQHIVKKGAEHDPTRLVEVATRRYYKLAERDEGEKE